MIKKSIFAFCLLFLPVASLNGLAQAKLSESAAWAATARYRIVPNVTYLTANNYEAKLDVYQPMQAAGSAVPTPTLIYIHGGGWVGTDVGDLLDGTNMKTYAVQWMGSMTDRYEIAKRVSPMNYVRSSLPPILTIHGDADPTVPYTHGVKLHEALNKAGVTNQLLTIPGGKHGGFTKDESLKIYGTIREFLMKQGIAN